MKKQYTVDEINDKRTAVLVVREDESIKIDIPLKDIPVKVKEGDIVNLEFKDNKVIFAEVDIEATKKARDAAQTILDDLKSKGSKDLKW
jgi:Protein of unknown function (DUF3006).